MHRTAQFAVLDLCRRESFTHSAVTQIMFCAGDCQQKHSFNAFTFFLELPWRVQARVAQTDGLTFCHRRISVSKTIGPE